MHFEISKYLSIESNKFKKRKMKINKLLAQLYYKHFSRVHQKEHEAANIEAQTCVDAI